MTRTKEEHDAIVADWRKVAEPCFACMIDWVGFVADPAVKSVPVAGVLEAIDVQPFRAAMVKHLGEAITEEFFLSALGGFQEDVLTIYAEDGRGLALCDAWKFGHRLLHLVEDNHVH